MTANCYSLPHTAALNGGGDVASFGVLTRVTSTSSRNDVAAAIRDKRHRDAVRDNLWRDAVRDNLWRGNGNGVYRNLKR